MPTPLKDSERKKERLLHIRDEGLDVVIKSAQMALNSVFLLNGGTAVALLSFFSQLIQSESPSPSAPCLMWALGFLGLGAFLAGLATAGSFLAQYKYFKGKSDPKARRCAPKVTNINFWLVAVSLSCFAIASVFICVGLRKALQSSKVAPGSSLSTSANKKDERQGPHPQQQDKNKKAADSISNQSR